MIEQALFLFVVTMIRRETETFIVGYAVWGKDADDAIHQAQEEHGNPDEDGSGDSGEEQAKDGWKSWEIQTERIPNARVIGEPGKPQCLFTLNE